MKKKLFISAFAALLLMCICALSGCSGSAVIDLKDYVSVNFSGFNGSGTARVDIDCDAMLPLIKGGDEFTAKSIADNFTAAKVENNGKLSNGDIIKVKVTYSEQMMKNAKINVKNTELSFPVSGLKEKEKLDVFANVSFEVGGTSPECTITVKYNGAKENSVFELKTESGEILKQNYSGGFEGQFKNGDKVTVKIADQTLEKLLAEYNITETSREYTVQSDSAYILTAADLTAESRKALDKAAEDFVNEKIEAVINSTDRDARLNLLSQVSGVNVGSLYAGGTTRIGELEIEKLNSAYVGVGDVSGSWGVKKSNQKSIYYIYDAKISYYIKQMFDVHEDETECALIVRVDDPMVTTEGVMYSGLTFGTANDFQSAYNSCITSKFEKLP